MLAQLVPQRELGKVYGLLAILDASLPFLGKLSPGFLIKKTISSALPLANPLWDATLDTMPGAFCLVNAGVGAILSLDAGERNTGERNTGELFQKVLMADQPRLWELSAASILLCGLSSVGTICSQPLPRVLLSECFVCFVLQERNYYRVAENHSSQIRSLSRKNFSNCE